MLLRFIALFILFSLSTKAFAGAACDLLSAINPASSTNNFEQVMEKASCTEVPVGQSKVVDISERLSPTTVEHKYELVRTSKDEYKVRLNLQFREDNFFGRKNAELDAEMRSKVQKCIQWMNPHLLGPGNQKLKIELVSAEDAETSKYKSITSKIKVSEESVDREDSHRYSVSTDCPTIAHELLHLMGLADEYKETENIKSTEQDCRNLGPEDSIMVDQEMTDLYANSQKQMSVVKSCLCISMDGCKKYSKSEVQGLSRCPEGFEQKKSYRPALTSDAVGASDYPTTNLYRHESFILSNDSSARVRGSFLYPAHFRAITAPDCKAKNNTYYSCSKDSYDRPFKIFGSCRSKKKVCDDPDQWLK